MNATQRTTNVVIGGGIIGLSIAYELAKRGHGVAVLESGKFARQATWAGAGIITPANAETAIHPQEHLEALSHRLHESWSAELMAQAQIDNGFRKCGGLYVARTSGEVASLTGLTEEWTEREIAFEQLSQPDSRFDVLGNITVKKAVWVPGESVFDNQLHAEALIAACRQLGVDMHEELGDVRFELADGQIDSVKAHSSSSENRSFKADNYFVAAGPWSQQVVESLQVQLPMQPVRGQIAMYKLPNDSEAIASPSSTGQWPILNEGSRYLVPRADGRVIAGATIEEVGFDCQTTESEIADLRNWAEGISSFLSDQNYVEAWAGLRPATYDGFPYLGKLGHFQNAFVATGHFKSGLHLSTGTAVVMADLVENKQPSIDLTPFSPQRV